MFLRSSWWFVTVMLAALGLGLGWAHLLEMPAKMQYDAATYTAVNRSMYRLFGLVGGPVQVLALVAAVGLAILTRRRRSFRFVAAGAIGLAMSLALWAALVQPVNAAWAEALTGNLASAEAMYLRLRPRWEYGHTAAFAAWLMGFAAIVMGLVREMRD